MSERSGQAGGEPVQPAGGEPVPPAAPYPPAPYPAGASGRSGSAYPPGRPDFEPPPQWAQPAPGARDTSGSPGIPLGEPEVAGPETSPPRRLRPAALVAIIAAVALVAAAVGATGAFYATMRWANPGQLDTLQPLGEDLGADPKKSAFPQPQDVSTVADALVPGVVQIKTASGEGRATGSGFILRADGHILTNNHVIASADDGAGTITVTFHDGDETSASIVGRSPSYDLAVIKVKGTEKLTPLPLGNSDNVVVGEPVVAVGSPLGLAGTVTSGIISAQNRAVTAGGEGETSFISGLQTDAAINPGNSGGPLANLKGEVVGVNSAIATVGSDLGGFGEEQQGSIGLGFAIPINQARRTAAQLIELGHAVYPVVGATVDRSFDGPGARIIDVVPGSGAARAGLKSGDLVTVINGHKVTGADDLIVQIRRHLPGEQVRITYERTGTPQDVLVTLGEEID